jgi:hypothetical protein
MEIFARNPFECKYLAAINAAKLLYPIDFDYTPPGGAGGNILAAHNAHQHALKRELN